MNVLFVVLTCLASRAHAVASHLARLSNIMGRNVRRGGKR